MRHCLILESGWYSSIFRSHHGTGTQVRISPATNKSFRNCPGSSKERSNFISISMSDLDEDLDYSDEVHAKRHLANVWSERLASVLSSLPVRKRLTSQRFHREHPSRLRRHRPIIE